MKASVFSSSFWIWPENHGWDLHNGYALFRKEFRLPKLPAEAPLFLTADQSYQLYVNGEYVCRGPARGFQKSWPYDEVDVRPWLRKGRNVFAIRAYNPGFSNFQYLTQGFAGLLVAAEWGRVEIVSDKTWKCRRQPGVRRDTAPTSLQLYCQEHIDLRVEDPGWMRADFDDDAWGRPIIEHPWNAMPWSGLEPRSIPMLEEREIVPARFLGSTRGHCAADYLSTRDITRVRFGEGLGHQKVELAAGVLNVPATGRKQFRSYLIDFGKTVVGSVGFEISGAKGGEILDTLHGETIDPATLALHFEPDKWCRMAFGHRLVCREGSQTHVFYHTFGFRYMVLTLRDGESDLVIRPFLRTTLYPLEQKGDFQSSDAVLQRIWETCAWTQRVCSLDAYVDTPWREQTQWWGDARVQAKNTFFYSGDTRLFRRGIRQIASQTTPDGVTYGHAPTMAHTCILPDFTLIWMLTIWDYYWQTGSLEPFQAHAETIRKALDYFKEHTDPRIGLVGYDKRYWLFLDWTGLFKEGYSTVYNLWLLIALERLAEMSRKGRLPKEAAALSAWAKRLRKSLARLTRKDGLLQDGLTFDRKIVKTTSLHAQTLAILAGFQPEHDAERMQALLSFICEENVPEAEPSAYWITYIFEALTAAGYGADVVAFIRRKWEPMAAHGTTWEVFEPPVGEYSFSHAWSAHPLYHFMQTVGGIRQTEPAWKEIVFHPIFSCQHGKTTVPTPHGPIRSAWERRPDGIRVSLEVPTGITARVVLPGQRRRTLRGGKAEWIVLKPMEERSQLSVPDESPTLDAPNVFRLLIAGDSITRHGFNDDIKARLGWDHVAGMAASEESKDFAHLFAERIRAALPDRQVELYFDGLDNSSISDTPDIKAKTAPLRARRPHLLVIQTGEHEDEPFDLEIFRKNYEAILASVLDFDPRPILLCAGPWEPVAHGVSQYADGMKAGRMETVMREICAKHGVPFASVREYADDPACCGWGGHPGVRWHPNDRGHAGYAEKLWAAYLEAMKKQ